MKDNLGIPIEVGQQINLSPTRNDVLYRFGLSLEVDSTLTGCPRRSVGSRDPNPCTMQAEVYSAHSVRRPESPQGLGRELFTRAGLMVFVSVRCLCGAAHVTLHSLTRAHTHVGPLLLMLLTAQPSLYPHQTGNGFRQPPIYLIPNFRLANCKVNLGSSSEIF